MSSIASPASAHATPTRSIAAAAGAAYAADQLALAALPLTAVLMLQAGPGLVGLLVAVQGAAWLLASLPAGVWVDRHDKRTLLVGSQLVMAATLAAATLCAAFGRIDGLMLTTFLAACGTVVFALATQTWLPRLVPARDLPRANGRLELARALATLLAPAIVGWLAEAASPNLGYAGAALAALVSAAVCATLRGGDAPAAPPARPPMMAAIVEGTRFVVAHPYLRAIVLCAAFWNFAFFALVAVFVPFALGPLGLDPRGVGLAQSFYGAGLVLGAAGGPLLLARLSPNVVLLGGPALSVLAALLIWLSPSGGGFAGVAAGQFLIGFGPMCWLICQTSLRQLVTPPALLGRVGATIQVAIYGVRSLGALAGGAVAGWSGLDAALALVLAGFALSFVVIALSSLARLRAMPAVQAG